VVTIIHTADLQLGKAFGAFDDEARPRLYDARFDVLDRIAEVAKAKHAALIVVAGDVFDLQGLSDHTLHRAFERMRAFEGPWVLLPGNHDAALADSVWTRAQRIGAVPAHVHLALRPEPLLFDDARIALLPAPLTQRMTHHDVTAWFDGASTPEGYFRVGLAHGSVQGILHEGIDSPNPIAQDRAARARLDYLALGDWHGQRAIDPRTYYAGTPEPDRFRHESWGRVLAVELDRPGELPRVESVEVSRFRWRTIEAELAVESDLDAFVETLEAITPRDVLEIELRGSVDLASRSRLLSALERARGVAAGLRVELQGLRTRPSAEDLERLAADGYVGRALAALRDGTSGATPEIAEDALILLADVLASTRPA